MKTTHTVTCTERLVMEDGRVRLTEQTRFFIDGAFSCARKDYRYIDIGDDISGEDELTRDIVKGKLHTAKRKADREAELEAALEPEPEDEVEDV